MSSTLSWLRFCAVWGIIIFTIYSGYNYVVHPASEDNIELPDKIIKEHKIVLSGKQKQELKNNFSKIDLNFSNRVIHTGNGATIERIK